MGTSATPDSALFYMVLKHQATSTPAQGPAAYGSASLHAHAERTRAKNSTLGWMTAQSCIYPSTNISSFRQCFTPLRPRPRAQRTACWAGLQHKGCICPSTNTSSFRQCFTPLRPRPRAQRTAGLGWVTAQGLHLPQHKYQQLWTVLHPALRPSPRAQRTGCWAGCKPQQLWTALGPLRRPRARRTARWAGCAPRSTCRRRAPSRPPC